MTRGEGGISLSLSLSNSYGELTTEEEKRRKKMKPAARHLVTTSRINHRGSISLRRTQREEEKEFFILGKCIEILGKF